jgi:hypothetical protein
MECFSDKTPQQLAVTNDVKFANKLDVINNFAAEKTITVSKLFQKAVAMFPDHPALRYKIDGTGVWEELTYSQYYNKCVEVARAYIKVRYIAAPWPATATVVE